MAFGDKAGQPEKKRVTRSGEPPALLTRRARLDELASEVQDRITFLQDMQALGQAARFAFIYLLINFSYLHQGQQQFRHLI